MFTSFGGSGVKNNDCGANARTLFLERVVRQGQPLAAHLAQLLNLAGAVRHDGDESAEGWYWSWWTSLIETSLNSPHRLGWIMSATSFTQQISPALPDLLRRAILALVSSTGPPQS